MTNWDSPLKCEVGLGSENAMHHVNSIKNNWMQKKRLTQIQHPFMVRIQSLQTRNKRELS